MRDGFRGNDSKLIVLLQYSVNLIYLIGAIVFLSQ